MKKQLLLLAILAMFTHVAFSTNYYVATNGSNSNSGTQSSPFATLSHAITQVSPGDYIYMRGGTYNHSSSILIDRNKNGNSSNPIRVFAFSGETPILNFSSQSLSTSNRGVIMDAFYWHWKGITIQGAGDNGMLLSGNNNIIENCIFRENRDTGLQLSRYTTSYDQISEWPSNNLITGCEAYDNADPDSEDADGFAAKLTCGSGNKFINCIAHHNIDDGWDLFTKSDTGPIGVVYFEGCISHNNGTLTNGSTSGNGDKNGYKLGSSAHNINHILRRCIAFNNGKHGFADNGNVGSIEFTNCTSYNNTQYNYHTRDGASHIFKNNLSFDSNSNDRIRGNSSAPNAFDNGDSWPYTASSSDFQTLTPGPNNDPTSNGFLNLSSGSSLINAGVTSTGITYSGSSPDLGAVESGGSTPPPPPVGISLSASAGDAKVDLSWTISGITVTGQDVYRDTDSNPSGRDKIATVSTNSRSYSDNTAVNGTTYYYWIEVNGSESSNAASATPISNGNNTGSTVRIEDTDSGTISFDGSSKSYSAADNGTAINLSNSLGKKITWNYTAPSSGTYTLTLRYTRKASMNSSVSIIVNDGSSQTLNLPQTASSSFSTASLTASLSSGTNSIVLETNSSGESADIDWIEISSGSGARVASVITDQSKQMDITYFPNPAIDYVTIDGGELAEGSFVRLFSLSGIEMIKAPLRGKTTLTVKSLQAGMYILQIETAGQLQRSLLLKK